MTKPSTLDRALRIGLPAALLLAPSLMQAAPLAYEGFSYGAASASLTGQAGGSGWGGSWQTVVAGSADVVSSSLSVPGCTPLNFEAQSTGNSCSVPNGCRVGRLLDTSAGGAFATHGYRDANGRIGADGKTVYISFLQQPNSTASYYEFELHRDDLNDGGRIGGIGNPVTGSTNVFLRAGATQSAIAPATTAVNFYVVRIDFKPGNDDVYVYRNPTSATEPGIPTLVKLGVADMSFNGISLAAATNGLTVAHDEIRIGETWSDVAPGTSRPAPLRILPVGDSITWGDPIPGGYRTKLYQTLTTAGYTVDFVGNMRENNPSTLPDWDHDGHRAWYTSEIDQNISTWLDNVADPDVILLHIGTNDFGLNVAEPEHAIDRWDALITKMATLRPHAHIIVTNLMQRTDEPYNSRIVSLFNPYVQDRVNAQVAAGHKVSFVDMRAAVPVSELIDGLHPNQTGYGHMADAWAPAIQAVIGVNGDNSLPAVVRAVGSADLTHVSVTFSKPVSDAAATAGNFSLSGGLSVTGAVLDSAKRVVVLTTTTQARNTPYTVTVNNVVDRTAGALALPANSTSSFKGAAGRGYLNNVPEAAGYTLAYSLDIPNSVNYLTSPVAYTVDNHNGVGPFSRVAYYLELQNAAGDVQYLWTSMNAFTTDAGLIGVPTGASGAIFQQPVTGMNVYSNVTRVTTGTNLTGNLEFWPTNYTGENVANVPNADARLTDFGDNRSATGTYGSMQVHNPGAAQTVFAFNNWGGTGGNVDVGIGLNPNVTSANATDWTFANNGADYTVKTLQVFVLTSGDTTPPAVSSAIANPGRTKIIVHFSEPLAPASVKPQDFTLSNGVIVLGATLAANQRDVILTTTQQPAGTALTLTTSKVRDSSPSANLIAPGTTTTVTVQGLPPEVVTNIGATANNYQLVASINLPVQGNFNSSDTAYVFDDRSATGPYSKVAYYLETQQANQPPQYVWVSMDAFTASRNKLTLPTTASGAVFQQNVTNLNVMSNVAGVVNGSTATGGNIEFWPDSFLPANGNAVPNASDSTYDFGDVRYQVGQPGYGSMQIHNHDAGAKQTVMAINHFGIDGSVLDIGIGNNPSGSPDWTSASNASNYTRRVLHVMVLPGTTLPASVAANVPNAAGYQLVYSLNVPTTGAAASIPYGVNNGADVGPFTRIGYYMELQTGTATPQFVWISMDAFTTDATKIGVPTTASGALFQQNVANMDVLSNVAGIVNGTTATGGNIEFWPNGYLPANSANVPNASAGVYDFGDSYTATAGYGSMQIHNHDIGAKQTLFAFNNFGVVGNQVLDLGIGNNPAAGGSPDWTFSNNATSYSNRTIHVFILPGNPDNTGPLIASAKGSTTLNRLIVTFNEPVSDSSAFVPNFSIPGLTITGATLLPSLKEIALTTSAQTPGTVYTVSATGIRDRSPAGNPILAGASASFTAYVVPGVFSNVPEIGGYKLAYKVAIPTATPQWNINEIPYSVDESRYGEQQFDRVAYLLELNGNYAYTSFDRHVTLLAKAGIPVSSVTTTPFQQNVTNLNVVSNVAGVVNGTGLAGGNIEFWNGNYTPGNALNIPNASGATYDFGDTMTAGSHGCLQVHNHDASQTILAFNNWGTNAGQTTAVGIGNNPNTSQSPDWTGADNSASYTTKNLYVLYRPSGPSGSAPVVASQPLSRMIDPGAATTFSVTVGGGTAPYSYQWRLNGSAIPGATNPWLDIAHASSADLGAYDVVITGSNTLSVTSLAASLSFTPPFDLWANGYPSLTGNDKLRGADPDGDGWVNLLEYAFGTDPTSAVLGHLTYSGGVLTSHGPPLMMEDGSGRRAVFLRRKDYADAGLTYTVQFSALLDAWADNAAVPVVEASDATMDAVSVPFPDLISTPQGTAKPLFFRVKVSGN